MTTPAGARGSRRRVPERPGRGRGSRRSNTIRTPMLVRSYLLGESFATESDPDGEAGFRQAQGDYLSRMHRRIKRRIREVNPRYQYPRHHSFLSLVNNLLLLGLVEKTGATEAPEQRGAGKVGVARGFQERTYYRLVPGADTRPEWQDPMLYIALRFYPNVRAGIAPALAGAVPAAPPGRARRGPPEAPRALLFPTTPRRPAAVPQEVRDRFAELQARQAQLAQRAQAAGTSTALPVFQQLLQDAQAFLRDVTDFAPQNPLIDLPEAVDVLGVCQGQLQGARGMTRERAQALGTCQTAARLLAEALQPVLRSPRAPPRPPGAPRRQRRGV